MTFAHPQAIVFAVLIAAAFGASYVFAQRRATRTALRYSNLAFFVEGARPRAWPHALVAAAWICAVALVALAFAGPRVHAAVPVRGGAVVLCVDTSGSMAAGDVRPSRAAAALAAMRAFIDGAPAGTAVGIVSFAGQAQEIAAPDRDRDRVRAALDEIPAPNGATAIGDALVLARRMLPSTGHRVVVLITDGEDNRGSDPMQAAKQLASRRITLFTVGIGTNGGALIPGTLQPAGIDEDALRSYALATGGAYSRAGDATQLHEALARLGRTTSWRRGLLDVSLETAAAGAVLMVLTLLWTKSISAAVRRSYERSELREATILPDPVEQLQRWLAQAHEAALLEANAMCVCTAIDGKPSARIVLLRGLDERGLVFFTSYFSRKGRELAANPAAAAVFYWAQLERQVRVEGRADRLPEDESDVYFATRPPGHQIGAWASEQSEIVDDRETLDRRVIDYAERFAGERVPRPHSWGGYVIAPHRFEFWQGRPNRMHDRLEFVRRDGAWIVHRLQP